MLGDNKITLNREAVKEALQEYIAKRFAEGHIPVVMEWEHVNSAYDRTKDQICINTRDPHMFLDIGTKAQ